MKMNEYEGLVILNADHGADAVKKTLEAVSSVLEKQGAKITQSQEWGRRRLGFPVRGKAEGFYAFYQFSLESAQLARVRDLLNLNDDVLRHQLLRKPVAKKLKPARVPKVRKGRPAAEPAAEAVEAPEQGGRSWSA